MLGTLVPEPKWSIFTALGGNEGRAPVVNALAVLAGRLECRNPDFHRNCSRTARLGRGQKAWWLGYDENYSRLLASVAACIGSLLANQLFSWLA